MTQAKRPPNSVIAYTLDDEDRTRRARSLLWPIAVILLAVALLVVSLPIASGAVLGLGGGVAGIRALIRSARSAPSEQA